MVLTSSESIYDAVGNRIATIDGLGRTTRYIYDDRGKLVETVYPDSTAGDDDNPSTSKEYDAAGHVVAETDELDRTTRYVYDKAGRRVERILPDETPDDADNPYTQSIYDSAGRVTAEIDARGNRTEFVYDAAGRRIATVLPDGTPNDQEDNPRLLSTHDEAGRQVTSTDPLGNITRYVYDASGRPNEVQFADATATQSIFDAQGRLTARIDQAGQTTNYEYDAQDRLIRRTDPDGQSISYEYDVAGNRTSLTVPSATTSYTFDPQNRLETVTDPDGGVTTYTYDTAGNLVTTQLPNGTAEERVYNELNRLVYLEVTSDTDETLLSFSYDLDAVGNRLAVEEQDGRRVEYAYDEIYRLVGETIHDPGESTPSRSITYSYDDVGNRLERHDSVEGTTSYTYDDNDRLLEEAIEGVATAYQYDANGNIIAKMSPTEHVFYRWDAENRLIAVDTDGDTLADIEYEYAPDGHRVASIENGVETRFLVDRNQPFAQVVEEYAPGGIIKVSYVHGLDLISQDRPATSGESFYHVDGLGSTRALSDVSGAITDRYVYDAFGRMVGQVGSTGNVYLFAGEQRDKATGLDYLRARYLNTAVGRFVSRDSFAASLGDPATLHRYLYANANPLNFVDPSGQFSLVSAMSRIAVLNTLHGIMFGSSALLTRGLGSAMEIFTGTDRFIEFHATIETVSATLPVGSFGGFRLSATSEETDSHGKRLAVTVLLGGAGKSRSIFPYGYEISKGSVELSVPRGLFKRQLPRSLKSRARLAFMPMFTMGTLGVSNLEKKKSGGWITLGSWTTGFFNPLEPAATGQIVEFAGAEIIAGPSVLTRVEVV